MKTVSNRKLRVLFGGGLVLFLAMACTNPSSSESTVASATPTTVAVTGISLDITTAKVGSTYTRQLNATILPDTATNKSVSWTSSKSSVATVTSAGLVTGVAAGSATITVTSSDGGYTASCTITEGDYVVGDFGPAGGYVFYDAGASSTYGWRYLECAPRDQETGVQWYNGTAINISTGFAIGTGKANTTAIVAAQGTGKYAASVCKNLSLGGFRDWFLPSEYELDLMYTKLKAANLGYLASVIYWSSTQYDTNNANAEYFDGNGKTNGPKRATVYVRAIRSF